MRIIKAPVGGHVHWRRVSMLGMFETATGVANLRFGTDHDRAPGTRAYTVDVPGVGEIHLVRGEVETFMAAYVAATLARLDVKHCRCAGRCRHREPIAAVLRAFFRGGDVFDLPVVKAVKVRRPMTATFIAAYHLGLRMPLPATAAGQRKTLEMLADELLVWPADEDNPQ